MQLTDLGRKPIILLMLLAPQIIIRAIASQAPMPISLPSLIQANSPMSARMVIFMLILMGKICSWLSKVILAARQIAVIWPFVWLINCLNSQIPCRISSAWLRGKYSGHLMSRPSHLQVLRLLISPMRFLAVRHVTSRLIQQPISLACVQIPIMNSEAIMRSQSLPQRMASLPLMIWFCVFMM